MPPPLFFNYDAYDYDHPQYTVEDIRAVNQQRHEMEQLSGIVYLNTEELELVAFKNVTPDEFWVRGHMPGFPLMPGVLICEAAAQAAGFYARKYNVLQAGDFIGFGGMDEVRFRAPIFPPCRLILGLKSKRIKPKVLAEFNFQAIVDGVLVANGSIIGVPITKPIAGPTP